MEIRITIVATYSNGLDKELKWYQWKLFNSKGRPIAKSHMNFQKRQSAIAAAKRMIKQCCCSFCNYCTNQEKTQPGKPKCPFINMYDLTNKSKKKLLK